MRTIVWFRGKDLRVRDHGPLTEALATSDEVLLVFVVDPYFFAKERAKKLPHRMQFLRESLEALDQEIARRGGRLLLLDGKSVDVIPALAKKIHADRVVAQRWVEPFGRERDRRVKQALGSIPFDLYEGEMLSRPGSLRTGAGQPYSVFTPFSRAFRRDVEIKGPLPAPRHLPPLLDGAPNGRAVPTLEELGLEDNPHVLRGGEANAHARLKAFLKGPIDSYGEGRDRMDEEGTSRLGIDLKFGTLSPRTVYTAAASHESPSKNAGESRDKFLTELIWREFTHTTLWDRPELLKKPFRDGFVGFPYENDPARIRAWKEGRTGYPIVDASQRQLHREGFVHNRARMISASFLTKHLMVSYREGESHYLELLTDGDWASNNAGWQWSAGCGCDAQPYFRVFNPFTQGEKFDPEGAYVRKYVPELRDLPTKYIHAPWTAPKDVLAKANVSLGRDYPHPIVDHAKARTHFLERAKQHLG